MNSRKVLISEGLLLRVMKGDKEAIEQAKKVVANKYIISKEIVEDAYYTYNRENAKKIFDVFGISTMSFVEFLYELYEKDSDMFHVPYDENVIIKIQKRYEYVKDFETASYVKANINFNTSDTLSDVLEKYITDDYYKRDVVDTVLRILKEAEILGIDSKKVEDFIKLKPFTEDSYYIFKNFGRFEDRVIKLYFNKDNLFSDIFDIASYLTKVKAPNKNLDNIYIENLNIGDNIEKILKNNGIRTINELQEIFDEDNIMSLSGIDVDSARIIINALGKFYIEY